MELQPTHQGSIYKLAIMPAPLTSQPILPLIKPTAAEPIPEPTTPYNKFKHITTLIALFSTLLITALNAIIIATAIPTIYCEFYSAVEYA